jgi:hypothetical protein
MHIPSKPEKAAARQKIVTEHNIDPGDIIVLFNGTLNYPPNQNALDLILTEINPQLQKASDHSYTIVICGNKLPDHYNKLLNYKTQKVVYAGFVENIRDYFLAADIFINPVHEGGGIKTKLVEALAANCTSVSFAEGAIGIPKNVAGTKLSVVNDGDSSAFTSAIDNAVETIFNDVPDSFFQHFYWDNIAKKAFSFIND